jgi:hypothetical protein
MNPIPKSNLFYTPKSFDELFERLEGFSNKQEKAIAYLVAGMVMNTCAQAVDKMMEETNEI